MNKYMAGSHVHRLFCWGSSLAKSNEQVKGVCAPLVPEWGRAQRLLYLVTNTWYLYRKTVIRSFRCMHAVEYRSVERTREDRIQTY